MTTFRSFGFGIAVFTVLVCSSAHAGTITGTIHFKGTVVSSVIELKGDQTCIRANGGPRMASESVIVNPNHTLRNVFVYIKSGLAEKRYATPTDPVTITQKGCRYIPHVLGMMVHQPLIISNGDPTLHNIHALPQYSPQFNLAEPNEGMSQTRTFEKPEIMVRLKCDVHRWMSAFIGVLDHPFYAVTDEKGSFTISGVPAGTYEIETWHEKYGTQTHRITVGPGNPTNLDITYSTE